MRRLGKRQLRVLECLRTYGSWPGQWTYGQRRQTIKLLESLVSAGVVQKVRRRRGPPFHDVATYYEAKP